MPTPERTSLPAIVSAGQQILESDGLDAVTMAAVAARVGVRPPSLYKRLRNRDELLRLIAEATAADLGAHLGAVDCLDARVHLHTFLASLRAFALARPAAYGLLFAPRHGDVEISRELLESTSAPLFAVVAKLAGPDHALEAARTITAWATGFIAMELAGAFRLGGEVDSAFDYGVARLADAIAARRPSSS